MNTSQYIPYDSVAAIMLKRPEYPEFPFLSGTGFFVYFPPYEDIFFITARHCVIDNEGNIKGDIKIPYDPNDRRKEAEAICFSSYLEGAYFDAKDEREDIVVYVADDISDDKKKILMKRALRLQHQDEVNKIINFIIASQGKIRTVGFPSISKSIDYEKSQALFQPRGFHAIIKGKEQLKNWYRFTKSSWKEGGLNGFSGSPILELCRLSPSEIVPVPIGVLLTTSQFLSINVATDLIATYLNETNKS